MLSSHGSNSQRVKSYDLGSAILLAGLNLNNIYSESKLRKIGHVETGNTRNVRTKTVLIKASSKTNFGVF